MVDVTPPGKDQPPAPAIDTTVPQTARVWNYWLGGKDNYAVDRALGDQPQGCSSTALTRTILTVWTSDSHCWGGC